ncbi:hypothetical protein LOTGIDRAFT_172907 [Lottia gigantea]|uniref:EF-hand domain-containing protein n=1 Tax=Lottia gigantea TaxID=225164 RepID=V4AAI4_LOTGI|nr:hypothetical protein LOTGIDRAFT_172907 [Lottia gigantea]ESP00979.1 hypothetical protein LOTGIDRAFT_172907 [Lottia gigantea]
MNAFLLLTLVAGAFAASCRHDDHTTWTETQVIDLVTSHMNRDGDNVISELNIGIEFVLKYDHNFRNGVELHEFTKQWVKTYHDEVALATHIFQHLDMDSSGSLDTDDIAPLIARVDTSGDGLVQVNEFKAYLKAIYNAC